MKHIKKYNEKSEPKSDIKQIMGELEALHFKFHNEIKSGETSKDFVDGFGLCLFSMLYNADDNTN